MTLDELYLIIDERKKKMAPHSYVASLFAEGGDRIIQKVGEEATEVVIAAKGNSKDRIVSEVADLLFHLLVLLSFLNINLGDILAELDKRHKGK